MKKSFAAHKLKTSVFIKQVFESEFGEKHLSLVVRIDYMIAIYMLVCMLPTTGPSICYLSPS